MKRRQHKSDCPEHFASVGRNGKLLLNVKIERVPPTVARKLRLIVEDAVGTPLPVTLTP